MSKEFLNILVISDLHCKHGSYNHGEKNTFLLSDKFRFPAMQHPVQALIELINSKKEEFMADILICPGDIAEKIDYQGLITGWSFLEEIKLKIGANLLIATVGNHDVNTHKVYQDEVFFGVKSLSNSYPFNDEAEVKEFWSRNFSLIQKQNILVLNFNSVWNFVPSAPNLPKINQTDIDNIQKRLEMVKPKNFAFKIAMCHHHPIHYSNVDNIRDTDWIDRGDELIKLLESFNFQIFIHGHKHDPRLTYSSNNLPLFCAGSFSSLMNIIDLGARNVFHLIKLNKNERKGTIKTYEYSKIKGWITQLDTYFPSFTGFGYTDPEKLVKLCAEWFNSRGKDIITFYELEIEFPDINHLNPDNQKEFNELLKKYNIILQPELPNKPKYITRLIL